MHRILRELVADNEDRFTEAVAQLTPKELVTVYVGILKGESDDTGNEMTATELLANLPEDLQVQILQYYNGPNKRKDAGGAESPGAVAQTSKPVVA